MTVSTATGIVTFTTLWFFSCTSRTFLWSHWRKETNSTWYAFHICHAVAKKITLFIEYVLNW